MTKIAATINTMRISQKEKKALLQQCRDGNPSALFTVHAYARR